MLEEFEGVVEKVELEQGIENRKQYHVTIKPTSLEVKGPTGRLHEWIPMSPTAKEDEVPQGSVLDRYLVQVEICVSAAKKAKTVKEALGAMVGKKFKFGRIKLGKDYNGQPAKNYIVPVAAL